MKCCICGNEINGYGNNPWPINCESENDRCCNQCDNRYVDIARVVRTVDASIEDKFAGKRLAEQEIIDILGLE